MCKSHTKEAEHTKSTSREPCAAYCLQLFFSIASRCLVAWLYHWQWCYRLRNMMLSDSNYSAIVIRQPQAQVCYLLLSSRHFADSAMLAAARSPWPDQETGQTSNQQSPSFDTVEKKLRRQLVVALMQPLGLWCTEHTSGCTVGHKLKI